MESEQFLKYWTSGLDLFDSLGGICQFVNSENSRPCLFLTAKVNGSVQKYTTVHLCAVEIFEFGSWIEKGTFSVRVSVVLPVHSHEYLDGTPKHTTAVLYVVLVFKACHVLRSRVDKTTSRCEGYPYKVWISHLRPSTRVWYSDWGLYDGLRTSGLQKRCSSLRNVT